MHQALTTPRLAREAAKKRRRGRRRKILFWSAGTVLLLIIGLVVAGKREKPIPVTTEKAVRRTILQTVSATGKVQPETEVKISPEVAGGNKLNAVGAGGGGEKGGKAGEVQKEC